MQLGRRQNLNAQKHAHEKLQEISKQQWTIASSPLVTRQRKLPLSPVHLFSLRF